MYVSNVRLNEFRAINASNVALSHPGSPDTASFPLQNVNVLLGLNGGGKSTILKGIAAATLAPLIGLENLTALARLRSAPQLGGTGRCSVLTVLNLHEFDEGLGTDEFPGGTELYSRVVSHSLEIPREAQLPIVATPSGIQVGLHPSSYFLAGYGHTRRVDEDALGDATFDSKPIGSVANLFSADSSLVPLESWVPLDQSRADEVLRLINSVLPSEVEHTGELTDGEYQYVQRGVAVGRRSLSDGLQAFLAWVSDLLFRLSKATTPGGMDRIPGVVLIDELDQRMHPQWQRKVVQRLSLAFPMMQFVCTAHSPLVVSSLTNRNLILLEEDTSHADVGATRAVRLDEDITGMSVDQLLWSSYFGMTTTRSVQFEQQQRALIDEAASTDVERSHQAAMEAMNALVATGRPLFRKNRKNRK